MRKNPKRYISGDRITYEGVSGSLRSILSLDVGGEVEAEIRKDGRGGRGGRDMAEFRLFS